MSQVPEVTLPQLLFPPYLQTNLNHYDLKQKWLEEIEKAERISGIKQIPVRTVSFVNNFIEFIEVCPEVVKNKGMSYFPLQMIHRKIMFETPILLCLFGLWTYRNEYHTENKHCVHFAIDDSNGDIKELHNLIDGLDMIAYQIAERTGKLPDYKHHSCLRSNYKDKSKNPTIRVKIEEESLESSVYWADQDSYMTTKDIIQLEQKMVHGKYYKAILEIMPIWFSAGKFGVTLKLLAIKEAILKSPFKTSFEKPPLC